MIRNTEHEYDGRALTGQRVEGIANGVDRVLATLRVLAGHPRGVTLTQITEIFDAPKSSMHRALAALCRAGFARQDSDSHYHLGLDYVQLAYRYQEAREDYQLVEPALRALAETFGETAHYAVLDGADVVYVAKVTPRGGGVQMTSSVGGRNGAYCTGVGKAMLMHSLTSRAAVEEFVKHYGPFERRTPHTLIEPDPLTTSLLEGRRRGYAIDDQENEVGINCIAFPLFLDSARVPAGAVSLTGLVHRTPVVELHRLSGTAQQIITEHLGDVLRHV